MTRVQLIEREIRKLDKADLAALRAWFQEFDSKEWDRQIAQDSRNGKLGCLASKALSEAEAGKTRDL